MLFLNYKPNDARIIENNSVVISLDVTPVGKARECLILLLHKNWNDCKIVLDKAGVLKICEDCAKQRNKNKDDFAAYTKCMLAVDLCKNKKVSLGYCADIADMAKEDFIKYLGKNNISIFSFENEREFLEELANA